MSEVERFRKMILEAVREGRMNLAAAAERLNISYRQARRVCQRYKALGDAGLTHRNRGRPSNRGRSRQFREQVIERYRDRYRGFGPTLACEKLAEEGLVLDHETLRRWLIAARLWSKPPSKVRHRTSRPRRERFGELVQLDGSQHHWFGADFPQSCLMDMVDDATGTTRTLMVDNESTEAAMRVLWAWIERYGIPMALYADRHRIYQTDRPATLAEELAGEEPLSAFGKACQKLGIAIIAAHSPQAKGRVERKHGVFQDRLVKELALRGINTIIGANALLDNGFVADLNRRFAVLPADPKDAHRPLPRNLDLAAVFCRDQERTLLNNFTLRHQNRWYQVTKDNRPLPRPRSRITVRILLDGTVELWDHGQKLNAVALPGPQRPEDKSSATRSQPPKPKSPGPDHPWRRWIVYPKRPSSEIHGSQRGHF